MCAAKVDDYRYATTGLSSQCAPSYATSSPHVLRIGNRQDRVIAFASKIIPSSMVSLMENYGACLNSSKYCQEAVV